MFTTEAAHDGNHDFDGHRSSHPHRPVFQNLDAHALALPRLTKPIFHANKQDRTHAKADALDDGDPHRVRDNLHLVTRRCGSTAGKPDAVHQPDRNDADLQGFAPDRTVGRDLTDLRRETKALIIASENCQFELQPNKLLTPFGVRSFML
jgi:hypothetical protein